jgi:hypothetical protein
MVKGALIILILFMLPSQVLAKREHPEKWYQERWCREQGGQVEVVLPDKTRCDCVTDTHAIEFDFGSNWAESVGQGLHYSVMTQKKGNRQFNCIFTGFPSRGMMSPKDKEARSWSSYREPNSWGKRDGHEIMHIS